MFFFETIHHFGRISIDCPDRRIFNYLAISYLKNSMDQLNFLYLVRAEDDGKPLTAHPF
jgi:hypothetical protein